MMVSRAVVVKATMEKTLITIVSKKFFGVSAVSTPEGELSHLVVGKFLSFLFPGTKNLLGKHEIRAKNALPGSHCLKKMEHLKRVGDHLGPNSFLNSSMSSFVMFFSSFGQVLAAAFMMGSNSSLV